MGRMGGLRGLGRLGKLRGLGGLGNWGIIIIFAA